MTSWPDSSGLPLTDQRNLRIKYCSTRCPNKFCAKNSKSKKLVKAKHYKPPSIWRGKSKFRIWDFHLVLLTKTCWDTFFWQTKRNFGTYRIGRSPRGAEHVTRVLHPSCNLSAKLKGSMVGGTRTWSRTSSLAVHRPWMTLQEYRPASLGLTSLMSRVPFWKMTCLSFVGNCSPGNT